jgi:CheY-like chemotaxis protein
LAVAESLMRPPAKEKGLEFDIVRNGQIPSQIRTDPVRLRQCLVNLISNAIKFTEKGRVVVKVSCLQIENQSYVHFDIEDTGIGIPPDKQHSVFERFALPQCRASRRFSGTGLGLPITRELAQLLDGELTLTSKLGKGSVFTLTIPTGVDASQSSAVANESASESQREPELPENAKLSGHVLVAEDSPTNQKLIKLLLERMGLEVTVAENGKEAVEKASAQKFDLILMDMQMPNINGYEATRILRSKSIQTAIVAVTAHVMTGDEQRCLNAGCNDYVPKPIDRRRLWEVVLKYLSERDKNLSEQVNSLRSESDKLSKLCSEKTASETAPDESAGGQSGETVIDWSRIAKGVIDEESIAQIIPVFLADNRKHLEMLGVAVQSADPDKVKSHAHTIMGAAASVGAGRVSQAARRLEKMALREDLSNAAEILEDVRAEFDRFESFVSNPNWIEIAKRG